MAREKSILKLQGVLGRLSFFEDRRYGLIVRRKGGPSKQQIRTRKSCAVVRQNNEEFGRASKAGKLMRQSFYGLINRCADHRITGTVQKKLMAVLKLDHKHSPGKKMLLEEHFAGFGQIELNEGCAAGRYFPVIDRVSGPEAIEATILVNGKARGIKGASHFRVVSVAAVIDFGAGKEVHDMQESGMYRLRAQEEQVAFSHVLRGRGTRFHGLCILFYQQVNGEYKLLHEKAFKAGLIACLPGR